MASPDATPSSDSQPLHERVGAWSGAVSWLVYILLGTLVVALALLWVHSKQRQDEETALGAAWDEVYQARKAVDDKYAPIVKDFQAREAKVSPEERAQFEARMAGKPQEDIAALETVFPKISGTPAGPFVAMELAQMHFDRYQTSSLPQGVRKEALEQARKLYNMVLKEWPGNALYAPAASEGAAICLQEDGDLDGSIQILLDAARKYEQHALYPELCYELGLAYWTRGQRQEAAQKNPGTDFSDAWTWLDRALSQRPREIESQGGGEYRTWVREARWIKSLLDKKGPGLPGGVVPPPKPTPAAGLKGAPKAEPKADAKPDGKAEPKAEAKPDGKAAPKAAP